MSYPDTLSPTHSRLDRIAAVVAFTDSNTADSANNDIDNDSLDFCPNDLFPFDGLSSPIDLWSVSTTNYEEAASAPSWPSPLTSPSPSPTPNSTVTDKLPLSQPSSRVPAAPLFSPVSRPTVDRPTTTATVSTTSIDSAYREVVKRKHRQVDRRRRQREAAWLTRLATLVSLPITDPSTNTSTQSNKRRALDKIATLESVANKLETLLQRVAELEQQPTSDDNRTNDTATLHSSATAQQQPVLAWPVVPPTKQSSSRLAADALSLNGSLVQGSIKALLVHAGTGRTVDCTSLAKLCMAGSIDCSLDSLSSPSWAACQRMLAPAAARGELSPFFYYSADQSSPVDFIGTAADPGLTHWLSDLYQLLTHRKSAIEGTKLFKLSDGQWHSSTSRLWLLDRGGSRVEQREQSGEDERVEVDWDAVVVVLSLSPHRLPPTVQQCEEEESVETEQAESEVAQWRQWSSFSPLLS